MCNVIFIDFKTLLDGSSLRQSSVMSLKEAVNGLDGIIVVCTTLNQDLQSFDYIKAVDELSRELCISKTRCFDALHSASDTETCGQIASWLSVNEVRSFAVVLQHPNKAVSRAYANNTLCYDELNANAAKCISWILTNYKQSMSNEDDVFFVSDTHFGHANIIKYCNRPWNSGKDEAGNVIVTEDDVMRMDDEMVKRWNSVVGKNSIVYHLGDFSFGGKETAQRIFPQLNGKIRLVMGNHDHYKMKWYYDLGFNRVYDKKIIINDFVILSHAPLMFLNENTPFFNCFGHVHDSPMYKTWSKTGFCACVERHDYTPVSWKTIKAKYDELNHEA